jgi:UDP-glucose:glycoprotein glucosyltransferase
LKCDDAQCGDPTSSLSLAEENTRVKYTLKTILVAGQCYTTADRANGMFQSTPPNGLQLVLTIANDHFSSSVGTAKQSETLVMQNLGYYQLQADPGLWVLNLAPGRASNIFDIDGATAINSESSKSAGLFVPVRSFADVVNRITVTKKAGMEKVSLLVEDGESDDADGEDEMSSLWKSFSSMMGGGEQPVKKIEKKIKSNNTVVSTDNEDNKIHVFSLATGHLYERLLRIMMLSVTKRTSMPVKFWLFENFLSPTFKTIAAAMAQEYGFEVAYVTYKWPEWLTQQTQKQRIIWGYKILFLDVLFPLNIKKVIYVDADQVLRADLKELWDTDLEGKPYAYTPFCTSRQETLGFQFWRQGYWAEHLRGRPYHISALYVVDLQKFRRNAVGDQLRAVYDQLARDPNSLANLDQDLPNYAQHVVPIHSLPQEWLWCETWCSDDSKVQAKTIDLCNNPLHKESKVDMAKRVISGTYMYKYTP